MLLTTIDSVLSPLYAVNPTVVTIVKTGLILFLIIWTILGYFLVKNYQRLFGPHHDDPAESAGARSFGVAHIVAVWVGGTALALYFLFQ